MILNQDLTDDIARLEDSYGVTVLPGRAASPKGNKLSDIAVLVIFSIFTISVFAVLIFGVNAYSNIHASTLENHEERIALSFVWTRVKSAQAADNVSVQDFHGVSALFIDEMIEGSLHYTIIYHYDGWLYENFFESGGTFLPRDGVRIIESDGLAFEQLDNGLIKVSAGPKTMFISPISDNERSVAR